MPEVKAKPGRKSSFSRADCERINRMVQNGHTDEQIAAVFDVHRTTIGRLRHSLEGGDAPEYEPNSLEAMIADEAKRLALRAQIYDAYSEGDTEQVAALWAMHQAI